MEWHYNMYLSPAVYYVVYRHPQGSTEICKSALQRSIDRLEVVSQATSLRGATTKIMLVRSSI